MGGFVISPLPPLVSEEYEQQGPFAPRALPRLDATAGPSATLSPPADFPGCPVIRPGLLRRFRGRGEEGFPSCSACPRHRAVATTPPERIASSANLRRSVLPSPDDRGLGLRGLHNFGATCAFTLVTARRLAHHPEDGFVNGLQDIRFPSCLPFKLRGVGYYPGGTDSHGTCPPLLGTLPSWCISSSGLGTQPGTSASIRRRSGVRRKRSPSRLGGF